MTRDTLRWRRIQNRTYNTLCWKRIQNLQWLNEMGTRELERQFLASREAST